jgi:hypothetical protein
MLTEFQTLCQLVDLVIITNEQQVYTLGLSPGWCFRAYMTGFHIRFAKYPKNPRDPKSIKRKAYMQEISDKYGIKPDKPFNGIFYFERKENSK